MRDRRRRLLLGLHVGLLLSAAGCFSCEPPSVIGELGRLQFKPPPHPLYAVGSDLLLVVEHLDGTEPQSVVAESSDARVLGVQRTGRRGAFEVEVHALGPGQAAVEIHGELLQSMLDRLTLEAAHIGELWFPGLEDPTTPTRLRLGAQHPLPVAALDDRGRHLSGHPPIAVTVNGDALVTTSSGRLNERIVLDAAEIGLSEVIVRDRLTGRTAAALFLVVGDLEASLDWQAEDGWVVGDAELRAFTDLWIRLHDGEGHAVEGGPQCWIEIPTPEAFEAEPWRGTSCRIRLWWQAGVRAGTVQIEELRTGRTLRLDLDAPTL
jgi:hypothetical protein